MRQVAFFDSRISPDRVHQFVFGEQPSSVADHVPEQIEGLRMQRNGLAGDFEDSIYGVHLEPFESVQDIDFNDHTSLQNLFENYLRRT